MENKLKVIFSLILCVLLSVSVLPFSVFAEGDCDEWSLSTSVTDGTTTSDKEITVEPYKNKYLTVQIDFHKYVGDRTYAPGEIEITVPYLFTFDCEQSSSTYYIRPAISTQAEMFKVYESRSTIVPGSVITFKNTETIDAGNELNGYFQIQYKLSDNVIGTGTETFHATLNSSLNSNDITVNSEVNKTPYTAKIWNRTAFTSFNTEYANYKLIYFSIPVTCDTGDLKSLLCKDMAAKISGLPAGCKVLTENLTEYPHHDGLFQLRMAQYSIYWLEVVIAFPDTINENINILFDMYGTYKSHTHNCSKTFSNSEYLCSVTSTINPHNYSASSGTLGAELIYTDNFNHSFNTSNTVSKKYDAECAMLNYSDAKYFSTASTEASFLFNMPYDLTGKTVRLGCDGILKDTGTNITLMSDSEYTINSINLFDNLYDINQVKYEKTGIKAKLYVKTSDNNSYHLYKEYNYETDPSKVQFAEKVTGFYVDYTGFSNGLRYYSGTAKTFPFTFTINNADVQKNKKIYLVGVADIFDNTGNTVIDTNYNYYATVDGFQYAGRYDLVSSYGLSHLGNLYSLLPYTLIDITYSPKAELVDKGVELDNSTQKLKYNLRLNFKFDKDIPRVSDKTTVLISIPSYVDFNFADLSYNVPDSASTKRIEKVPSEFVTIGGKKYVKLTNDTQSVKYYYELHFTSELSYQEMPPIETFTAEIEGYALEYYSYDKTKLNVSADVAFSLPLSAVESVDAFSAVTDGDYIKELNKIGNDGLYSYKLRAFAYGEVTDAVFYDNLETAYGDNSHFEGVFDSIDTSYAENRGYVIKTYYNESAAPGTLENDSSWKELTDSTDKAKVKSLAFKINDSTGKSAVIPAAGCVFIVINMKAPGNYKGIDKAYNNFSVIWRSNEDINSEAYKLTSNTTQMYLSNNKLTVTVTDENSLPLPNAKYTIKKGTETVAEVTSTEMEYILCDLAEGNYSIIQTEAPEGYHKDTEKTFTIDNEHTDVKIILVNARAVHLPETGSITIIILIALTAIAIIAALVMRKKENKLF